MKTSQLDKATSVTLKYLLHFLSVALFFGIMLYSVLKFWLPLLVTKFSKIYYISQDVFMKEIVILLVFYSLFCYFANNFILDLYKRGKGLQLLVSVIVDILIVPLSLLLLIVYYDKTSKGGTSDVADLYNIYVVTLLLVLKVFIFAKMLSKGSSAKKA